MMALQQIEPFVKIEMTTADTGPPPEVHHVVLMTEPNREMTAQANLIIRRVPFYLPTIFRAARLSARRHAEGGEHPDVTIPLFPRVVLVAEADLERNYSMICATPGMLSRPFMRFGEQVAVLRPRDMQVIRYIEAGERAQYLRKKFKKQISGYRPQIGEEVRILVDELLGGMTGKVSEMDSSGRITILTELMKRTVRVKLTANQIEPV